MPIPAVALPHDQPNGGTMNWKPYAKAITGGLLAGLAALGVALADDRVTALEWTIVAGATLAGLGGVYAVPNRPAQ